MEIGGQFSLEDFLAYFFPGILSTLGIFVILLYSPIKFTELINEFALVIFLILLSISYSVGVLFAGLSEKIFRNADIKGKFPKRIEKFENELMKAFRTTFDLGDKEIIWGPDTYYLCRSLVVEMMPNIGSFIHRQIAIRQLRMNLFIPLVIWIINGFIFGVVAIRQWPESNRFWGIILIVFLILFTPVIMKNLKDRMDSNEEREVREVISAFLAGFHSNSLKKIAK
jgi:hypothetical protein